MNEIFEKRFFTRFTTAQLYLIVGNFVLVFFLILLSNLGVLPIKNLGDFLFVTFLVLFFALYRPGWAFLFLIGAIALENINLAPESLGIAVRPYQFLGGLIIAAVLVRWIARRLNFELLKLKWYDGLLILAALAGFLSSFGAADGVQSFKLSIILFSFVALYLLARNYVRDLNDLKKIIPFFLSSSVVIIFYGIWQNIRFARGLVAFEVMPGRPNATFPEADWLGIYLLLLLAVIYAIVFYLGKKTKDDQSPQIFNFQFSIFNQFSISKFQILKTFLYLFLALVYALLIITVSRSAWLGAGVATFVFLLLMLLSHSERSEESPSNTKGSFVLLRMTSISWKNFGASLAGIIASGLIAVAGVYFFHLTNFQLFNRAQSVGTGLQKITIACAPGVEAPERGGAIEELEKFGCRHINLEDIEKEIGQNNIVKEIYRDDPNVSVRSEIYEKSWQEIRKHPILGIGWGSIGKILGKDARGASLNASNIFLEIWLGSGILGLLAFLAVWFYILGRNISNFAKAKSSEETMFAIFIVVGWFGLTVANLFNSGILLGFLWLFMAISFIEFSSCDRTTP